MTTLEFLRFVGADRLKRSELALSTGIYRSRLARIFQGRTSATVADLTRLLQALEVDCSIPVLTTLITALAKGDAGTLRVDWLSGTFSAALDYREWLRVQKAGAWHGPWYWPKTGSLYSQSRKFSKGFSVQRKPVFPRAGRFRVEIKGRAFDDSPALARSLEQLGRAFDWTTFRRTRLDVAVNLPLDIGDILVVHPTARTCEPKYRGANNVPNYYLGRRRSAKTASVYDYASRHGGPAPMTRIESRLKKTVLGLGALASLENPFSQYRVFAVRRGDRSSIEMLLNHAHLSGAAALRRAVRTAIVREALVDFDEHAALAWWHPRAVFARLWPAEANRLVQAAARSERA